MKIVLNSEGGKVGRVVRPPYFIMGEKSLRISYLYIHSIYLPIFHPLHNRAVYR